MSSDIDAKSLCPLCKNKMSDGKWILHGNFGPVKPHLAVCEVWCENCKVFLRRHYQGAEDSGWITPNVTITDIAKFLTFDQIKEITKQLRKYPKNYKRWREGFLIMKQKDDKFGIIYDEPDMSYDVVLFRGDRSIALHKVSKFIMRMAKVFED